MTIGGKVGVDVFAMIGAYFLIDKSFKFKRIVKLTLMIVFYTWVIYAILKLSNYNLQYQWYELWLPVPGTYWFAGSYIVLLFITPVLNLVIENITQEQYRNILYFLTLIFVLIPTFIIPNIIDLGLSHSELGNSTVSTFAVYLIHDNQFIRGILWGKVNNSQYQSSSNFLIHGLEVSLLTLVICIVIELVRQIFFNRIFGIIEEKLGDLLSKKLGSKKDY